MYPIDCLLKKIPAFNKKFDAAALKDKVGIFAENHVLGFILGVIFGLLAQYPVAETLTLAIQCAAALTLFPVITKYFMQALSPISEAVSDFMNKKFKGRTLLVGLDWPFLGGSNEIWLAVIWSVPVTLICAMLLPGNAILPFAGIHQYSTCCSCLSCNKGKSSENAYFMHTWSSCVPVGRYCICSLYHRPCKHNRCGSIEGRRNDFQFLD